MADWRTEAATSISPTRSAEPDQVSVDASSYLGQPLGAARAALEDLGLDVDVRTVANPDGEAEGTVASVSPTGRVDAGSTVTLSVYGDPLPTETPTVTSPGSETPSDGNGNGNGNGKGGG